MLENDFLKEFKCQICFTNNINVESYNNKNPVCIYSCSNCNSLTSISKGSNKQSAGGLDEINNYNFYNVKNIVRNFTDIILENLTCPNTKCKNPQLYYKVNRQLRIAHTFYYCNELEGGCGCLISVGPAWSRLEQFPILGVPVAAPLPGTESIPGIYSYFQKRKSGKGKKDDTSDLTDNFHVPTSIGWKEKGGVLPSFQDWKDTGFKKGEPIKKVQKFIEWESSKAHAGGSKGGNKKKTKRKKRKIRKKNK